MQYFTYWLIFGFDDLRQYIKNMDWSVMYMIDLFLLKPNIHLRSFIGLVNLSTCSVNDAFNQTGIWYIAGVDAKVVCLVVFYSRQLQQQQQAELEVHQRDGLTAYDLSQVRTHFSLSLSFSHLNLTVHYSF